MPYYSKRKRTGSRSYRKKAKYGRKTAGPRQRRYMRKKNVNGFKNVVSSARWGGLTLPGKVMKKFEYEDTEFIDTTNFNLSKVQTYVTNCIYDPDYTHTATDHSVQNYGVFCTSTMYRQWRVFGCKMKVTFINLGGSQAMVVPLLTTQTGIPAANMDYENTNALTATPQSAEPVFVGPLTGGNNIVRRTYYAAPWVALGLSRTQYTATPYTAGAYASRPTTRSFLSFVTVGVGAQATIEIRVSFVYYAQLMDLAMGADTITPS